MHSRGEWVKMSNNTADVIYGLTPRAFDIVDEDEDGYVSEAEWRGAGESESDFEAVDYDGDGRIDYGVDTDGDGRIDFEEFQAYFGPWYIVG